MATVRIMLDTNVVIDCIAHRGEFYEPARKIMLMGSLNGYEMWMASSQISDIIYVMSDGGKKSKAAECRRMLANLRKHVHVYATSEADIDATAFSAWEDLEDCLIHQAALRMNCDCIVTRNEDDFVQSGVPVVNPLQFFTWLEDAKGLVFDEITF